MSLFLFNLVGCSPLTLGRNQSTYRVTSYDGLKVVESHGTATMSPRSNK